MGQALGYETEREDGTPRDSWAVFLDPVGACIQPSRMDGALELEQEVHEETERDDDGEEEDDDEAPDEVEN